MVAASLAWPDPAVNSESGVRTRQRAVHQRVCASLPISLQHGLEPAQTYGRVLVPTGLPGNRWGPAHTLRQPVPHLKRAGTHGSAADASCRNRPCQHWQLRFPCMTGVGWSRIRNDGSVWHTVRKPALPVLTVPGTTTIRNRAIPPRDVPRGVLCQTSGLCTPSFARLPRTRSPY